ncbi:MAG: signal peptidase I [Oscillospiraceae bacterium]|nr:signal peptidase I [Oscillospiraceae bacterium]
MKRNVDLEQTPPLPYQGLNDWMRSVVTVFLPFLFILTFMGQTRAVEGVSMEPTLVAGEQMIIRSILYTPARGDVIILARHDLEDGAALVKRVIALAGDVVDIDTGTGTVYVNGLALDEPYTSGPTTFAGNITYPYTVPPGRIFVIGDNRGNSLDSRSSRLGSVDEREIIGQVVAVILPLNRARLVGSS